MNLHYRNHKKDSKNNIVRVDNSVRWFWFILVFAKQQANKKIEKISNFYKIFKARSNEK